MPKSKARVSAPIAVRAAATNNFPFRRFRYTSVCLTLCLTVLSVPPSRGVVLSNDFWTLVLNENQATLGRVFLALNRHETAVAALTDAEVLSLWAFVRETNSALTALFAPDHFNYMFLMNLTPHVHFHLFPRYAQPREFSGQTFTDSRYGDHYDPQESQSLDAADEAALIAALRHALTQPTGGAQ